MVFSGLLFDGESVLRTLYAFILFTGITSSIYIFNDIIDIDQDRKHPFKKKRPIASGKLPLNIAWFIAITFSVLSLVGAMSLSIFFFILCLVYITINLLYSTTLKRVPVVDIMMIATGFIIRVYAGAIVNGLHMNVWFLFTVISLSLFLAVGKRQSERTLLTGYGSLSGHRVTLTAYSQRLLDVYTSMFATATWFSYALFAFQHQFEQTEGPLPTILANIPRTLIAQKWLMLTVPVVIFGVMRYMQLVYEKNQGESPARVLLADKTLLTTAIVWTILVIAILYGIR